jgi:hypothetical protein
MVMTDQGGKDEKPPGDDDMEALLNAIRTVAREDDVAIAGFSGETAALSAEERARISERILALQGQGRPASTVTDARAGADARIVDRLAARRGRTRRGGGLWTGAAVALAAAAALVLWLRPHPVANVDGQGGLPGLPTYAVSATGGIAELRGPAPGIVVEGRTALAQRLNAQSELEVACRPDSAVAGPMAARAFLVHGGAADEVRPDVQVAPTGAVALRIRGAALVALHTGEAELRVVIGRPAVVSVIAAPVAVAANDSEGVRWLTVPLRLEP